MISYYYIKSSDVSVEEVTSVGIPVDRLKISSSHITNAAEYLRPN